MIVIYEHSYSGLYYERVLNHASSRLGFVRVMNYNPRVMLQIVASLMIVICDHNMFIVQAGNTKGGSITVLLTSCFTG